MENLRPNKQRAKNAIILIWVVLALEIVNLISSYFQYDLLQTVANGGTISEKMANANDMRESILAILSTIAYVVSAVTFIMWFRRAYYNLHQKVDYLTHSDGWAAGGWFVPIVCLYLPYQIMKEIYVETKELFDRKGLSEKVSYTTNYVGWWWAFWIITAFIANFILRYTLKNVNTVDEYITLTVAQMISSVLEIPFAFLAVKVINDYSKVEPMLNEIND